MLACNLPKDIVIYFIDGKAKRYEKLSDVDFGLRNVDGVDYLDGYLNKVVFKPWKEFKKEFGNG